MLNIEFDNIVNEKLQQIIAIDESTRVIVENERLRLLSLLKGKHIVVQGQKGWNKGVVKDVRTSLPLRLPHILPAPIFRLEIQQTNTSPSKYVSPVS